MFKKGGMQKSPDGKEKARKLTEAEKKRLEEFEKISERMEGEGYRRVDLTVSIVWANVFAIILLVPVLAAGLWAFIARNGASALMTRPGTVFISIAALIVMVVVHELIHGLSWAPFTGSRLQGHRVRLHEAVSHALLHLQGPAEKGTVYFRHSHAFGDPGDRAHGLGRARRLLHAALFRHNNDHLGCRRHPGGLESFEI